MPIHDIFSKRAQREAAQEPDVYVYDDLPKSLRVQIVHIWDDTLGGESNVTDRYGSATPQAYAEIVDALCREYGVFELATTSRHAGRNHRVELIAFFINETNAARTLDAIELSFQSIEKAAGTLVYDRNTAAKRIKAAIDELNTRLREAAVGYVYEKRQIIRIDRQFAHAEIVKPALTLLAGAGMEGANQEFLSAFDHYRKGESKAAINDALKSFESTLKVVCDRRSWPYDKERATAKDLIDICFKNDLVPAFWQNSMSGLRSLLEGSVPTARNRLGAHGQGAEPKEVPDFIVGYVLHMTAAAIVFLGKALKAQGHG